MENHGKIMEKIMELCFWISVGTLCHSILFDTMIVVLKVIFENGNFEKKKSADDNKSMKKLPSMQRVNWLTLYLIDAF